MRHLLFFITICMLIWLGSTSPINPKRRLINRPTEDMIFNEKRSKRHAAEYSVRSGFGPLERTNTEEKTLQRKGYTHAQRPLNMNLRKGEYLCGDKICKLKPGEIPRNCNGMCQYPVKISFDD